MSTLLIIWLIYTRRQMKLILSLPRAH